ncbi:MAG TPA: arsinothricin resistance N-acetyltransferase ArsN1 family B [Clostridia bacterium]|nr:arsinothricin resistance N-acetyltransferase ArsN1 family B [Clostridia bacterium]
MLRFAKLQDAEQFCDIYAPYVLSTSISFETAVPSKDDMERRIEKITVDNPWLVFEDEKCIMGYAYASRHRERAAYRWSVDTSIYIRQDERGKGIGKELYNALLSILKLQGYYNAYAGICLPNEASVGIHEYLGFKKIAHYNKVGYKLGQWHDVGWWELLLKQHESTPEEPLHLSSISEEEILRILSLKM